MRKLMILALAAALLAVLPGAAPAANLEHTPASGGITWGQVATEGLNQGSTYASFEDGVLVVEVVPADLQPDDAGTHPGSADGPAPVTYPLRLRCAIADGDGQPFPPFTRVEADASLADSLRITNLDALTVDPDFLYMAGGVSQLVLEKRFSFESYDDGGVPANRNLPHNASDSLTLKLTKPSGEVITQTLNIRYDAVKRISIAPLTLEAPNLRLQVGRELPVTIMALRDGVPVTDVPMRYDILTGGGAIALTQTADGALVTGLQSGEAIVRIVADSPYGDAQTALVITVVAPETPPELAPYVCKVRKLTLRAGAGTAYAKVGELLRGDIAHVYEVSGGWARIDCAGQTAYASTGSGKYLQPM